VFRQAGLSQTDAPTTTDTLLADDSWGIHTHGLKSLGGYVKRLNGGGHQLPSAWPSAGHYGGAGLGAGGWGPVLGNNPIAYEVPAGEQLVLLDIATSTGTGGEGFPRSGVGGIHPGRLDR
jgi:LDH2 family malate/lactate/ureidoglycolate dehydrogenase